MKSIRLAVLLALLLAAGCRMPWSPAHGVIVGTVVDLAGKPVRVAEVSIPGAGETFTSFDGGFQLTVPPGDDSLTVLARDGYDGRVYAVTHFGSVRVKPSRQPTRVRIVLSESASLNRLTAPGEAAVKSR